MSVFEEPKIDAHCHVLDPVRFPYAPDVAYRPAGQEVAPFSLYQTVMRAYGIEGALLVGPNSGYGSDNRCLLGALAEQPAALRGVAVVGNHATPEQLLTFKNAGVVGIAFNATVMGVPFYAQADALLRHMAELDLLLSLQVEHDQLLGLLPLLRRNGVRVLIDHCGRPNPNAGVGQAGFQALLALAQELPRGHVGVKLSGFQKFSSQTPPYEDALPYVRALIDAFTLDHCLWASDWPFLKAPERLDVGPLIQTIEHLLPLRADRERLWWTSPRRWLGFDR